jgi:hypothetical protein
MVIASDRFAEETIFGIDYSAADKIVPGASPLINLPCRRVW